MVRVSTGGRLHIGFLDLSLAHERLYGGIGLAVDEPRLVLEADRADGVDVNDPEVEGYVRRAVDVLDAPGATVRLEESLPRHVGLGSGTQLALAAYAAIARAYDRPIDVRKVAPALGRGGRSGVGVAAFETGGFVVDAGHPSDRFTTARPADGEWTVPPVSVHREVPESWRFVLAIPDLPAGKSGEEEDASMRSVVERADPQIADEISRIVLRRLLPAVAGDDPEAFGAAAEAIGRLNGAWYADVQGGVYRPPVGDVVRTLSGSTAVYGVGQSSWGPTVYGVTERQHATDAKLAARDALEAAGVDGIVRVVAPRNRGATIDDDREVPIAEGRRDQIDVDDPDGRNR